ncbi:carboxypeptidase regulatory-like domain-containing protein [Corallococcus macrosporus]|uniref:Carboxypeptidase regulatory-like domain-containing protein n=1 Tax=Corallococcus macrosporus TaxID=35 RepID=A0ABS3DAU0_9BACT|nr:carboxypeptidase-like regulatory domain-containing protein [Corallococcus macrosporus]MBN8228804.1 carboxypeptidase regulatory-like domain-containing protein [Corallococcus macrosporus]
MRFLLHVVPVLALLLTSAPTSARSDSAIFGTVIDVVTREPIGDVVISATSPSLQKPEEVTVTDAQGNFRIPRLPPGVYALRFEHEHQYPYKLEDLQLREGRSLRTHVELAPADSRAVMICY